MNKVAGPPATLYTATAGPFGALKNPKPDITSGLGQPRKILSDSPKSDELLTGNYGMF